MQVSLQKLYIKFHKFEMSFKPSLVDATLPTKLELLSTVKFRYKSVFKCELAIIVNKHITVQRCINYTKSLQRVSSFSISF